MCFESSRQMSHLSIRDICELTNRLYWIDYLYADCSETTSNYLSLLMQVAVPGDKIR